MLFDHIIKVLLILELKKWFKTVTSISFILTSIICRVFKNFWLKQMDNIKRNEFSSIFSVYKLFVMKKIANC